MARQAGRRSHWPTYLLNHDPVTETGDPPPEHIIAYLCRCVGIAGEITLRPYFVLSEREMEWGSRFANCIAIQSGSLNSRWMLLNKQWPPDRFGPVAEALLRTHEVVQVGHAKDREIPCSHDLHGRTTLRSSPRCSPIAASSSA